MSNSPTKEKVIDAASSLFFQKGFHATSVRDIANRANVNVSLISYYFKSKQGLLEYAVTEYYEKYLMILEKISFQHQSASALEKLKKLIATIIQYKQDNHQISCFIHRELSMDSIFVREMAVTYLAKENFYLENTLFEALQERNRKANSNRHYLLLQLKGMLITPYILHHDWKKHVIDQESHQLFAKNYISSVHGWIDFIMGENVMEMEKKG